MCVCLRFESDLQKEIVCLYATETIKQCVFIHSMRSFQSPADHIKKWLKEMKWNVIAWNVHKIIIHSVSIRHNSIDCFSLCLECVCVWIDGYINALVHRLRALSHNVCRSGHVRTANHADTCVWALSVRLPLEYLPINRPSDRPVGRCAHIYHDAQIDTIFISFFFLERV